MATGDPGLILTTLNDLTCSQVKVQYDWLLKRTSLLAPVSKVANACAKGSTQKETGSTSKLYTVNLLLEHFPQGKSYLRFTLVFHLTVNSTVPESSCLPLLHERCLHGL